MARRWPEVRAGLIAIAIGFGLVDGCPLPDRETTLAWQRPIVEPVRAVRDVAEKPVAWIVPALRVSQKWALYQHPGGLHFRMWLEGQDRSGTWRLLYRAGDPEHAEDAAVIDSGRVWGVYTPTDEGKPPLQYFAFCRWITGRALVRHPELVTARVRLEQIDIEDGVAKPTGAWGFPYVHPLGGP